MRACLCTWWEPCFLQGMLFTVASNHSFCRSLFKMLSGISLVVWCLRLHLSGQRVQDPSLVGDLRSHMPRGQNPKHETEAVSYKFNKDFKNSPYQKTIPKKKKHKMLSERSLKVNFALNPLVVELITTACLHLSDTLGFCVFIKVTALNPYSFRLKSYCCFPQ